MNPCDLTMSPAEGLSLGLGRQSRDFLKQNNQPFFFFFFPVGTPRRPGSRRFPPTLLREGCGERLLRGLRSAHAPS